MSLNISGSNNVNFGWSCETHRVIMETAIKDMPQFNKYKETLEDYVQRPDHDDIGFLANKHFYFGEKIKTDTFSKEKFEKEPIEKINDVTQTATSNGLVRAFSKIFNAPSNSVSFMDFNGRNNAKAAFEDQIEIMDNAIEDEDDEFAIQNAARACHFLQDVSQPQHIEETSALGKAIDLKIHTDYEKFAEDNAQQCAQNFKTTVRNPRQSMQLFADTFGATKELGKITRENEPNWGEITQKQFNLAVQSTKEFLQNVSDQMGLEYRNLKDSD
jgi:hypothetical protein